MATESTAPGAQGLQPGTTFGPYRIDRLLGRGGMGAVYEAVHLVDGRTVALKLLSVDLDQLDARQRFLREGQTAAAINHPNAVYIYGTDEIDGTPVITMELVPGGTLEEKVKTNGPMSVAEAVESILQIIDGLDAALAAGVLHRDIKPSNCFVTEDGVAKIGDFGLSKPVEGVEQHKLTQTGLFLGTPVYSSPEQLLGETLDVRSDIYAVGVTFYYLLTGRLPYETGSLMQVMAAVLNGTPSPMNQNGVTVPPHVQEVVLKTMARHAKDRYQDYTELREAIAALRAPEFVPATLWERLRAWIVDSVPLSYLVMGTLLLIMNLRGQAIDQNMLRKTAWVPVVNFLAMLLAIALPEGRKGMALGKWLLGIRMVGLDGRPIGFMRSAARVFFLSLPAFASGLTYTQVKDETATQILLLVIYLGQFALMFSTARKSNGWTLLHDKLTQSRVVRPLTRARQRKSDVYVHAPSATAASTRIGRYAIDGAVTGHPAIRTGWDEHMQRRVWLVPRAESNATPSVERRGLSRLARLRWTGSAANNEQHFDVFEAPSGTPLLERMQRPVSWHVQLNWLSDLTAEVRASNMDGTWPSRVSTEQLWVTANDEILLLEPSTTHEPTTPSLTGLQLLSQLASMLEQHSVGVPLPRYAARTMEQVRTAGSVEQVEEALQTVRGKPTQVTRRRRIGPMAVIAAVPAVIGIFSGPVLNGTLAADRDGALVTTLTEFIDDAKGCSTERGANGALIERCLPALKPVSPVRVDSGSFRYAVGRAIRMVGLFNDVKTTPGAPKTAGEVQDERKLAAVYLKGRLESRINDSLKPPTFLRTVTRRRARHIIDSVPAADSLEMRRATQLVDSTWVSITGERTHEMISTIQVFTVLGLLAMIGSLAVICALLFRRGILLRAFQLDIIDKRGRPAARWRLFLRSLLDWPILLLPFIGPIVVRAAPLSGRPATVIGLVIVMVGAWIWGIVTVIRTPHAGIPEQLTGTMVVVE